MQNASPRNKTLENALIASMAATAVVLSCAGSTQAETAFEVSGSLEHLVYHQQSYTNQWLSFKMLVSGGQWQIISSENEDIPAETTTTCDGANIFHYCKADVLIFSNSFGGVLPHNCNRVIVEQGPVPSGGYHVEIPWFAYASSKLAQSNFADLPTPWMNPRYSLQAHVYEPTINLSAAPPYLPESATFIVTKERAESASGSPWLDKEAYHDGKRIPYKVDQQWRPREPFGFTGATYNVIATTNIHGLTLPVLFELAIYVPSVQEPIEIFRGTNIIIRERSPTNIQPGKPDKAIYVMDFRFSNESQHISYLDYVSWNWISSTNETELQRFFNGMLENPDLSLYSRVISAPKPKRVTTQVVLVVALLFPLFFMIYQWRTGSGGKKRGMG
jgi:hypothetical protein